MSYYVEYNPELKSQYPSVVKKERKPPVKWMLLVLSLAISAYVLISTGLLRYLIPGDPDATVSAFSSMVERVGDGQPVRESVVTFFQEVIVGGLS